MLQKQNLATRAEEGKAIVWVSIALLLAITSAAGLACLWRITSASQETTDLTSPKPGTDESQSVPAPTGFDYVQLFDRKHWLVAEGYRVLQTNNAGDTWSETYRSPTTKDQRREVSGLSFIDGRTGFLIVGQQVLVTDDGGTSWKDLGTTSLEAERIHVKNCYFVNRLHGWAVGLVRQEGWVDNPKVNPYVGTILVTQDGGVTWQRQQLDLPRKFLEGTRWSLNDVAFTDTRSGWAVGDQGVTLWTEDGGKSWHLVSAEKVDFQQITLGNNQLGWATYRYGNSSWGVALTNDGGRKWELLNESFVYGTWDVHALFLTPKHGFAVSLGLFETRDGGKNWIWRSGSNKPGEQAFHYLGRAQDGSLVAIGFVEGKITSLVSASNGTTWELYQRK